MALSCLPPLVGLTALLACLAGSPAAAALVINELLADPPGADAGREFVEILNSGPGAVDLQGVTLEFANGAVGAEWSVRWSAVPSQLQPGDRLLVTDRNWTGAAAPDAEVWLGLQNGPDALRLARDGVTIDLVGYGSLTDVLLYEGAPVPLPAGRALARRPDGRDSDDNAADFVAAAPTPGRPNFLPWSVALAGLEVEPPSLPAAGREVAVTVTLRNEGLNSWQSGSLELRLGETAHRLPVAGFAPGATAAWSWIVRPSVPGARSMALTMVPVPGDTLELVLGRLQVGPGALLLNEVQGAPGAGEGEWFELRVAGAGRHELAAYRVRDADGDWRALPPLTVAAGGLALVAQDSAALAERLRTIDWGGGAPDCPVATVLTRLAPLAAWPTLNNTPPAGRGFADRLLLADSTGMVVDHVTLGGPGTPLPPAGRSLERTAVAPVGPVGVLWAVCTAATGSTAGCTNSVARGRAPGGAALELAPRVLESGGRGAVHASFLLPDGALSWRLRVYDLWGGEVRDFGGDDLGGGPRDLVWDGRDDAGVRVPAGGYVFVLETVGSGTGPTARALCVVR